MLELLILYSLNKQEQTLYGLRKMIATHFGEISIPSHGALLPSIKKMQKSGLIDVRVNFSEGGKKYTYYSTTDKFISYFNDKFMMFNSAKSETPEAFLLWLKIRLITVDIVEKSFINDFKEKCLLKLNYYEEKIKEKFDNSYIELNPVQKQVMLAFLDEISKYKKIVDEI